MEGMPLYHQKMFTQGGMDFNDEMSTLLSYVPRNPLKKKMFSHRHVQALNILLLHVKALHPSRNNVLKA